MGWDTPFSWRKRTKKSKFYHLFLLPDRSSLCNGMPYNLAIEPANCIPEPQERCVRCEGLILITVGLTINDTQQAGLRVQRFKDGLKEDAG